MKGKWRKRIFVFAAAFMAGLFIAQGMPQLAKDLNQATMVVAETGNVVKFGSVTAEANTSSIVYVDIVVTGTEGETVKVTYETFSGTAIEDIDYEGVSNSIALKIDGSRRATYRVAVKCKNDSSTREKLRVVSGNNNYGRYFNLKIVAADNANIGTENSCKCYLPYNYQVEATVGIVDPILGKESAYLNDYKNMIAKYHKGDNDISGKEHWRTWNEGISFNNDTTKRWVNTFINNGFASAYGSYILKSIDDDKLHSTSNIYMLSGNKQFMDGYIKDSDDFGKIPGKSLYYEIEPCKKGGYRIDGKAMYYISEGINPYKKKSELVDMVSFHLAGPKLHRYWIQESDTWYSSKNSVYDTVFYKTDPYNGVLDYGLSIFNNNKSWDREVHNIWLFLALCDTTCPTITQQYCEFNKENGAIRVFLRFNEPVFACKRQALTLQINNYSTNYYANYVGGNYSDTLIYELPAGEVPTTNITSIKYQMPSEDIGDMAYNLDAWKQIKNNLVQNTDMNRSLTLPGQGLDLSRPHLSIDVASSVAPHNVYNLELSANNGGTGSFETGVAYYSWDKNEEISDKENPASYANTRRMTSDMHGSLSLTFAKNEAQGIDSGTYYLHALVVSPYGFTDTATYGPYLLDGDSPEIVQKDPELDELKKKTLVLTIEDKAVGTDIETVSMCFHYLDAEGKDQTRKLDLVSEGDLLPAISSIVEYKHEGTTGTYRYHSNINPKDTSVSLDQFVIGIMNGQERISGEFYFEVSDAAGNKSRSNILRTIYDTRENFELIPTFGTGYEEITDIVLPAKAYDIAGRTDADPINFRVDDEDVKALIDQGAAFSIEILGDSSFLVGAPYSIDIHSLKPGYYEAVGHVIGMASGTQVNLISQVIPFYLSEGMEDITTNKAIANGNLVLSNRVYQFEDLTYYYYKSSNSSVGTQLYGDVYNEETGKWEGGSSSPTFSNSIEAKKYIKFMEYQDLELISISDAIARVLNSGSGSTQYVKAAKETKNAQAGQLWVRYKRNSWTPTSGTGGWAFYYYGEGSVSNGLNVNGLSENLNDAIEEVTNRIVGYGKDTYLIGEDYTDSRTGAPTLSKTQMHVEKETATATRSGNTYVSNPVYQGDAALYQNTVIVDAEAYPLATNMALSINEASTLFFKAYGASTWNPLIAENGTLLRNALADSGSGLYTIREYGDTGISEFTVFLDKTLPTLNVTLNKGLPEETTITLDGELTDLTCKNLSLNAMLGESDSQAYVAVYSYPSRNFVTALYGDAITNYSLSEGNYYLLVGDRSGNAVTYRVLTSDTRIDMSVEVNDAKTGVVVRTNNRSESEIYSFEVYLNEQIIDNEFADYKFYRGPGIYRIEIVDIYGNSETIVKTFEAPTPDLTWYYVNDSGGYSPYDPENPVRMILEDDPYSPRTTNVYASSAVRIVFNNAADTNNVEFEMLDLDPTGYGYNDLTGTLVINSLSSWRLRVWYKNQPENDRTYVFNLDTNAPEISASLMGTSYRPYVLTDEDGNVLETASFDLINFDQYQVGDYVSLDNLAYVSNGEANLTFHSGDVISGTRVVLTLTDPSGIRSVSVTRDGQPLEIELSPDNELILNSFGSYVVTVTDKLSNSSVFTFVNVDQSMSEATLDGTAIKENTLSYGHEGLELKTLFPGTTTVLVRTTDPETGLVSGSYAYEFRFVNGILTYGYYQVFEEEIEGESGPEKRKYSEFQEVANYSLNLDSDLTKRDTWYAAVRSPYFIISAMLDADGLAHYKVEVVGPEIQTEISYSVGSSHLPNAYQAVLSKEAPTLVLLTDGEPVEIVASLDCIYISGDLTIDTAKIPATISTIEIAYAKGSVFPEPELYYKDGVWYKDLLGQEYGYYRIVVTNKYNNQTVYLVDKIEAFASVVTIHCLDGSSVTYHNNQGTFYANESLDLIVMSTEVMFLDNDTPIRFEIEGSTSRLTINRDGIHNVRVLGNNGVFEDFVFEIKHDADFVFEDSWIVGYNEKALLRDQGYTNTPCSIVLGKDVVFVDMVVNDQDHIVLWDNITDDHRTSPEALVDAIGRYGVGKYMVGFRNKYGDLVQKAVYFNNVPALKLTRTIVSDPSTFQEYDLAFALQKGFYSNYILRFSTDSQTYVFTINDEEYRLDEPKTLEFSNLSGKGSFSYHVAYRDEYGNEVEFEAVLFREDVEFDATKMTTIAVNNTLYTKNDVVITFEEGLKATLSIDGQEAKDYVSGEVHYADGEYRFVVRDIAGNNVTYVIVHKSMNHYTLTNTGNGQEVMEAGVINNATVSFAASDGSLVKYVVRNGELLADYTGTTFTATGHYELLIEDAIGNQAYEEFYILNNELAVFEYQAPFEYQVTEVWRIKPDGTREMLNYRGPSIRLDVNGDYVVVVTSDNTPSSFNFTVAINNTPPTATLVGAENGGVTAREVTLKGLKTGDVVKVYKNGELISTTNISLSTEGPKIDSGGKYVITITNLQGVTIEYNFTRKAITNVAGSIFIIVFSVLVVVGVGIGLTYHTKLKTDD
ncbi:MAG: hypothetical protein IJU64_06750 [Bacilli bacterium]|nr:hypothetical protein [Bacilli bacterium]